MPIVSTTYVSMEIQLHSKFPTLLVAELIPSETNWLPWAFRILSRIGHIRKMMTNNTLIDEHEEA